MQTRRLHQVHRCFEVFQLSKVNKSLPRTSLIPLWNMDADGDRNVRRRLNEHQSVLGRLCPAIRIDDISFLCNTCLYGHRSEWDLCDLYTSNSIMSNFIQLQTEVLLEWVGNGMLVFDGLSQKRRDKWSQYCPQEKWLYYATELINLGFCWGLDSGTCCFLDLNSSLPMACSNPAHITVLVAMVQKWNSSPGIGDLIDIDLVIFASLELWWFGYKRVVDGEQVVVQMTFDESEEGGRIIVNRLERTEECNDFESIMFHNTRLQDDSDTSDASFLPALDVSDLRYLLVSKLVDLLLLEVREQQRAHASEAETATATATATGTARRLVALQEDVLHCVRFMRALPTPVSVDSTCAWEVGCLLRAGLKGTATEEGEEALPYTSALEAYEAALRWNAQNYLVRMSLVECYVEMGEHYLAHQHCLCLIEQLAPHVSGDFVEAPIAVSAHDYAAELVDTLLQDIHQLHLRGEEGYEKAEVIPGVGARVDVEWALDEDLVLYHGVVRVHPDGRSLCIAYADDVEPGQHRRRFESALHLVNINDPQDQYLENYFLSDEQQIPEGGISGEGGVRGQERAEATH